MNSTRKSLILSGIAFVVCIALFIGSTFAWFTNAVGSAGNSIESGSFSIQSLAYEKGTGGISVVLDNETFTFGTKGQDLETEKDPLITEEAFQAGDTNAKLIEVKNTGKLAVKAKLHFYVTDDALAEALWFDLVPVDEKGAFTDESYTFTRRPMTTLSERADEVEVSIQAKETEEAEEESARFLFVYGMYENAGNAYSGDKLSIDISVLASQDTAEQNGFGDSDYDKNALYYWSDVADTSWYQADDKEKTEYSLSTPEELAGFASLVNTGTSFAGKTIKLTDDIDLGGKLFQTINGNGKLENFTLDGGGHTISNAEFDGCVVSNTSGQRCGSGLFGQVNNNGITIQNLTFKNADAQADRNDSYKTGAVGVICGYVYGSVTFDNVKVMNSSVTGMQKAGGFVGYAVNGSNGITFKNCEASGITFHADYQCSNFVGYAGAVGNHVKITYDNVETKPGTVELLGYEGIERILKDENGNQYSAEKDGGSTLIFTVGGLYDNISYGKSYGTVTINGTTYQVFDTSTTEESLGS